MKVKVIRCYDKLWYKSFIGEIFEVDHKEKHIYYVKINHLNICRKFGRNIMAVHSSDTEEIL